MVLFVKIQKDPAYFKRFNVKFRRRREAKTDYKARRRMIQQAKNKYNTPKYRFVVRISNRDVCTQIVHSKLEGDQIVAAAYSHELKTKYGIKVGLTNYAACYATGLLCARRLLTKIGLADKYVGVTVVDGKMFQVKEDQEKRPFKAVLDTGLARTTSGARIFAALKGAVDGGIAIPHSPARFSGASGESLDATKHRARLLGKHVADYLKDVVSGGAEGPQFQRYIKEKLAPGSIEQMWLDCHKAIRADPSPAAKKQRYKGKSYSLKPRTTGTRVHIRNQRRAAFSKVAQRVAAAKRAAMEEEESD